MNKNIGKYNAASSDIIEVAEKCLEYHKKTGGYFDPRIIDVLENIGYDKDFKNINYDISKSVSIEPLQNNLEEDLKINSNRIFFGRRMDFSGIAKGYITDRAIDHLKKRGYESFLVDSGGDIRVYGKDNDGENWKISLESIKEDKLLLELTDEFSSIATSGLTRRKWENEKGKFHHLVNPKDPEKFDFNIKSVTVVAKTCEEADVWAKVLFLMGKDKGLKFGEERKIKSLFLDYRGNVTVSSKIKENIINTSSKRNSDSYRDEVEACLPAGRDLPNNIISDIK